MTIPAELGGSRYVSLTTFRRDGTPVATAVWQAVRGEEMFVVSDAGAGKVKRIRNNGRVVVTACDIRGRIAPGAASAEGTARLLDDEGTRTVRAPVALLVRPDPGTAGLGGEDVGGCARGRRVRSGRMRPGSGGRENPAGGEHEDHHGERDQQGHRDPAARRAGGHGVDRGRGSGR